MNENRGQKKCEIFEKYHKYSKDELLKIIEEIEQKAFMAGYDYAIEVLKAGKVHKKEKDNKEM